MFELGPHRQMRYFLAQKKSTLPRQQRGYELCAGCNTQPLVHVLDVCPHGVGRSSKHARHLRS